MIKTLNIDTALAANISTFALLTIGLSVKLSQLDNFYPC